MDFHSLIEKVDEIKEKITSNEYLEIVNLIKKHHINNLKTTKHDLYKFEFFVSTINASPKLVHEYFDRLNTEKCCVKCIFKKVSGVKFKVLKKIDDDVDFYKITNNYYFNKGYRLLDKSDTYKFFVDIIDNYEIVNYNILEKELVSKHVLEMGSDSDSDSFITDYHPGDKNKKWHNLTFVYNIVESTIINGVEIKTLDFLIPTLEISNWKNNRKKILPSIERVEIVGYSEDPQKPIDTKKVYNFSYHNEPEGPELSPEDISELEPEQIKEIFFVRDSDTRHGITFFENFHKVKRIVCDELETDCRYEDHDFVIHQMMNQGVYIRN
jgi:hypothetical protein